MASLRGDESRVYLVLSSIVDCPILSQGKMHSDRAWEILPPLEKIKRLLELSDTEALCGLSQILFD